MLQKCKQNQIVYSKTKKLLYSLIILFLAFSTNGISQNLKKINWISINEALELNNVEKKMIFLDLYTEWCGWCTRMDQTTFADNNAINFINNHFISAKFNAEGNDTINFNNNVFTNENPNRKRYPHSFASYILRQGVGYPAFAVFDENNNIIGVFQGYQSVENLISLLTYFKDKIYLTETYQDWINKE